MHAMKYLTRLINKNVLERFEPFVLVDSGNNDSQWRESQGMEN